MSWVLYHLSDFNCFYGFRAFIIKEKFDYKQSNSLKESPFLVLLATRFLGSLYEVAIRVILFGNFSFMDSFWLSSNSVYFFRQRM